MFRLNRQYFGQIRNHEELWRLFFDSEHPSPEDFPRHDQILFADHSEHCVTVLYVDRDKIKFLNTSEGECFQFLWVPQETTFFDLWKERIEFLNEDTQGAWRFIIGNNVILPVDPVRWDDFGNLILSTDVRGMDREEYFMLIPASLLDATKPDGTKEEL